MLVSRPYLILDDTFFWIIYILELQGRYSSTKGNQPSLNKLHHKWQMVVRSIMREVLSFWPNTINSMYDNQLGKQKQYLQCFSSHTRDVKEKLLKWGPFILTVISGTGNYQTKSLTSSLFRAKQMMRRQEAQVWAGKPKQRIQSHPPWSRSNLSGRQI